MKYVTAVSTYVLLLGMTLGLTNLFMSLLVLELLSWVFVVLVKSPLTMKYLLIQSVFFLMSVLGVIWSSSLVLTASLMIKMGLPPFHLWFVHLASFLEKKVFLFFTVLHKVLPFYFLLKMVGSGLFFGLGASVLIMSGIFILEVSGFTFVLLASSFSHSGWLVIGGCISLSVAMFYWWVYALIMITLIMSIYPQDMELFSSTYNSFFCFGFLVLSGMPPFSIFWLKASIFSTFLIKGFYLSFVLIMVSVMSLTGYFRLFLSSLSGWYWMTISYSGLIFIAACIGFN